jgi:hypothetical protein
MEFGWGFFKFEAWTSCFWDWDNSTNSERQMMCKIDTWKMKRKRASGLYSTVQGRKALGDWIGGTDLLT